MAVTTGDSTTGTARSSELPPQPTGLTDFERDLFTTNGGRIDEDALRVSVVGALDVMHPEGPRQWYVLTRRTAPAFRAYFYLEIIQYLC